MQNKTANFYLPRSTKAKSLIAECNNQAVMITSAISSSSAVPKIFCKHCLNGDFICG